MRTSSTPRRIYSCLAHHDDVERCDRALETLEGHLADRLHLDVVLDFRVETLCDQDLAGGRLVRKPRREVRNRADRRIVGAALEADLAAGRVAKGDASAEVEVITALPPPRRQLCHFRTERATESHGPQRGVRDLDRVVEEELDAVALEEADRRVEPPDQAADRFMELAEHPHQLLRLDRFDEDRPAAEICEEHRDLAAVAGQDRLVARQDDRVGELWREESLQPPRADPHTSEHVHVLEFHARPSVRLASDYQNDDLDRDDDKIACEKH